MNDNKLFLIFPILLFLSLPNCFGKNQDAHNSPDTPVIDLMNSVKIIRSLIRANKLGTIVEEYEPEQLEALLNNVSPAQMAMEGEVINCTLPVVVYYYQDNEIHRQFTPKLQDLAKKFENQIKFVMINAEHLFVLAQLADLQELPTIILVSDGKEQTILKGKSVTIDTLQRQILKNFRLPQK